MQTTHFYQEARELIKDASNAHIGAAESQTLHANLHILPIVLRLPLKNKSNMGSANGVVDVHAGHQGCQEPTP